MAFGEWEMNEDLEAAIDRVDSFIVSVREDLVEIDGITLLEFLSQVTRLRVRLDRLTDAVEARAPLGELEGQIAQG
jgi:hypothetical protein